MQQANEGVLGLRMRKKNETEEEVWGNAGGTPLLFMSTHSPHARRVQNVFYIRVPHMRQKLDFLRA